MLQRTCPSCDSEGNKRDSEKELKPDPTRSPRRDDSTLAASLLPAAAALCSVYILSHSQHRTALFQNLFDQVCRQTTEQGCVLAPLPSLPSRREGRAPEIDPPRTFFIASSSRLSQGRDASFSHPLWRNAPASSPHPIRWSLHRISPKRVNGMLVRAWQRRLLSGD